MIIAGDEIVPGLRKLGNACQRALSRDARCFDATSRLKVNPSPDFVHHTLRETADFNSSRQF